MNKQKWVQTTFTQLSRSACTFLWEFFPHFCFLPLSFFLSPTMSPVFTQYMLMSSSIGLPDQAQPPIAICNLLIRLTMINNNIPKCSWEVRRGGNDGEDELLRDRYDLNFFLGFFFFLPTWFEQVFSQLSGCTWIPWNPCKICSSASPLAYPQLGWLDGWSHGRASLTRSFTWGENLHSNQKRRRHENLIIIINSPPLHNSRSTHNHEWPSFFVEGK